MTRQEFIEKATRRMERDLGLPPGWWGTWRDIYGPYGVRVRYSSGGIWTARSLNGKVIGWHDSRAGAIRKARSL